VSTWPLNLTYQNTKLGPHPPYLIYWVTDQYIGKIQKSMKKIGVLNK